MIYIYKYALYLAVIGIPFISSFNGVSFLGGLGTQLSFYPLAVGAVLWIISCLIVKDKIAFPKSGGAYILLLFMFWIFISGVVNIFEISNLTYQGVNGLNRYIAQFGSIIAYIMIVIGMYNWVIKIDKPLNILRKGIYLSLIISGLYSLFELIVFIDYNAGINALSLMDSIFRVNAFDGFFLGRLRSVSAEASYFGMYIGMAFPWLVSAFFESKKHKILYGFINVYFLLLVFMTQSRTAYLIVIVEFLILGYMLKQQMINSYKYILAFVLLLVICLMYYGAQVFDKGIMELILSIVFSVFDTSGENLSNVARYGSQIAAYNIFLDNPIFGVGYGMFGFYASEYYPSTAWISSEIQEWGTNIIGNSWPPAHGLYARLLGETGALGLIIWVYFILKTIKNLIDFIREGKKENVYEAKIILVSLLAAIACGFNVDGFIVIGMWIFIAYAWSLIDSEYAE